MSGVHRGQQDFRAGSGAVRIGGRSASALARLYRSGCGAVSAVRSARGVAARLRPRMGIQCDCVRAADRADARRSRPSWCWGRSLAGSGDGVTCGYAERIGRHAARGLALRRVPRGLADRQSLVSALVAAVCHDFSGRLGVDRGNRGAAVLRYRAELERLQLTGVSIAGVGPFAGVRPDFAGVGVIGGVWPDVVPVPVSTPFDRLALEPVERSKGFNQGI